MYRLLFRILLMRLPAETAHHLIFSLLRLLTALPGVRTLMRGGSPRRAPELRVRVFGRELPGPVGLAAGFDKDARGYEALAALGFGFVEVGTVTPRAQAGNPQPAALAPARGPGAVNRLGFNNRGAEAAARPAAGARARTSSG